MRYLLLLGLILFVSGCISDNIGFKDQYVNPEKVVISTDEFQSEMKDFTNYVFLYSINITKEEAVDLRNYIPEFEPKNSTLVIFGNRKFYNKGYVYQVDFTGNVLSRTTLDSYVARSGKYIDYSYHNEDDRDCTDASIGLSDINYDGNRLDLTVENTGPVNFTSLELVTVKGNDYNLKSYNVLLGSNESYTITHYDTEIDQVQIYPGNCIGLKLKTRL